MKQEKNKLTLEAIAFIVIIIAFTYFGLGIVKALFW
jgi:hypothetical protein